MSLINYLKMAAAIFTIGIIGITINKKNIITFLIAVELIILAANINFIASSIYLQNASGQVFSIFSLAIAAAESAICLAVTASYFQITKNIEIQNINEKTKQ